MTTTPNTDTMHADDVAAIDELRDVYDQLKQTLAKIIVGQEQVIEHLAICLFSQGHALLMGVPGLAKTLLVSRFAETMALQFSRIQFTPDLMPMDITGTDILQEIPGGRREFEFVKGPLFANLILADEINRAPFKNAGRDARGDAGIQNHGHRQNIPTDTPVLRAGDAEPHRTGRDVSVAGGATGSFHVQD